MDDTMSHSNDLPPGNFGILLLKFRGNFARGFPDYFNKMS